MLDAPTQSSVIGSRHASRSPHPIAASPQSRLRPSRRRRSGDRGCPVCNHPVNWRGGGGGGGVEPASADGTCASHHPYKVTDGHGHDRDGDGVGCEGNPQWPSETDSPTPTDPPSSDRSDDADDADDADDDSGYDRDNWDYDSSAARQRLGCSSSEHVDHIVALKEAYDSSASTWTGAQKRRFANDSINLWCLDAGANISKSDRDLAEWSGGTCAQRRFIAVQTQIVKAKYSLTIDPAERRAIDAALSASCPSTTAPSDSVAESTVDVRIIARLLSDGRIEFGLQRRATGVWAEHLLPRPRFFPVSARVGKWLVSGPIEVKHDEPITVRITARRLADGRVEFALQERKASQWSERLLPRSRYFPTNARVDRWLRSSLLELPSP